MSSEAKNLTADNAQALAHWCGGRLVTEHDALDDNKTSPGINVPLRDGVGRASVGDTIIRQHDGTFSIFKGTTL